MFVYERRRFVKIEGQVFIALLKGNVGVITLYIPVASTRASAPERWHLCIELLILPAVYFQVDWLTFVFKASPTECMHVKNPCLCNIGLLGRGREAPVCCWLEGIVISTAEMWGNDKLSYCLS